MTIDIEDDDDSWYA